MDKINAPGQARIEGSSGMQLFFRSWAEGPVRAILIIVPGFNSHSGYYEWVGEVLGRLGVATYAIDLRGRGNSDGERFYVEDFDHYVADVHDVVQVARDQHPGAPIFMMGHSAGGVVAWLYAMAHGPQLAGLISESFAFQLPAPDFALAVLKGISHLAPHAHVLALKNADFSRDAAVVAAMDADRLIAHETQPTRTLAAIVRADARLKSDFGHVTLPVLILHGSSDRAAKPAGSQFAFDHVGSADKTLKLYDGVYHDPLNDLGRETALKDIEGWLLARISAVPMSAGRNEERQRV